MNEAIFDSFFELSLGSGASLACQELMAFISVLVVGVWENLRSIDETIRGASRFWRLWMSERSEAVKRSRGCSLGDG